MSLDKLEGAMREDWFPWREGMPKIIEERGVKKLKSYQRRALQIAGLGFVCYKGDDACDRCRNGRGPFKGCLFAKVLQKGSRTKYRWGLVCANCAYANKQCEDLAG